MGWRKTDLLIVLMTVYDYRRPCYPPGRNTFVLRATVLCNQALLAFQITMLLTLPGGLPIFIGWVEPGGGKPRHYISLVK